MKPGVLEVDYQHIDFTNTPLDVLGLPPDDGAEGVSVFAEQRPLRDMVFYRGPERYVYDSDSGTWRLSTNGSGG